eukprot:9476242-Pyramimonas_sp.AAC.1
MRPMTRLELNMRASVPIKKGFPLETSSQFTHRRGSRLIPFSTLKPQEPRSDDSYKRPRTCSD